MSRRYFLRSTGADEQPVILIDESESDAEGPEPGPAADALETPEPGPAADTLETPEPGPAADALETPEDEEAEAEEVWIISPEESLFFECLNQAAVAIAENCETDMEYVHLLDIVDDAFFADKENFLMLARQRIDDTYEFEQEKIVVLMREITKAFAPLTRFLRQAPAAVTVESDEPAAKRAMRAEDLAEDSQAFQSFQAFYNDETEMKLARLGRDGLSAKELKEKDVESMLKMYEDLAVMHGIRNEPHHVLDMYSKELALQQAEFGAADLRNAVTYNKMGNVFQKMRQLTEALKCFRNALDVQQAAIGEMHPSNGFLYNKMASVVRTKGWFNISLEYYKKALDIELAEASRTGFTGHVEITYDNLIAISRMLGQYKSAIDYGKKKLAILEERLRVEL
jgi:tetratricopeptide (TPR) repeat protein